MYVFVYWLDVFYVEPPWHGWKCKPSRWETKLNFIFFLSENYMQCVEACNLKCYCYTLISVYFSPPLCHMTGSAHGLWETETPPTLEPGKRAGPARCRVWVHRTESRTSPLPGLGSPDREQDQPAAESGFTGQRAGPARCRVWVHRHMENMKEERIGYQELF
ncbi:unnamed protein product [Arctogadus glacialis]